MSSFIVVNLANKDILHFLITTIMAYIRIPLRKNRFMDSLVEHFKENHESAKCIDLQFSNLKGIWDFILVLPRTYICMKEVIDSSLRRAL